MKYLTLFLKIIAYAITLPLFIIWLLFCAIIALIGVFLPKKNIAINLDNVKRKQTVCSVLNKKGLLSNEEYNFETNEVASQYEGTAFTGYLLILAPIIFLLKNTSFADSFILIIVHKWMDVHNFKKTTGYKANKFYLGLANTCVAIAANVGQFLHLLK